MKATYFGPPTRRLFSIAHPRDPGAPRQGGVLLAAPFGQEAVRTHRFYRVLAERLSRLGFDAMRFDFFGSGDSDGDDHHADLHGWVGDMLAAHARATEVFGAPPTWWLGSRLAGSAALLAKADLKGKSVSLALWDPVLDGRAYLESLRVKHVEALEASFSVLNPNWRTRLADPTAYVDEAIGFAISASMREQVLALTPDVLRVAAGGRLALLCSPSDAAAGNWLAAHSVPATLERLDKDFDWTSDDSLNTALVPLDAMNALLRLVHERSD